MSDEATQRRKERLDNLKVELSQYKSDYLVDVVLTATEILTERAGWDKADSRGHGVYQSFMADKQMVMEHDGLVLPKDKQNP